MKLDAIIMNLAPQLAKGGLEVRLDGMARKEHQGGLSIKERIKRLLTQQPDGLEFLGRHPSHSRIDRLPHLAQAVQQPASAGALASSWMTNLRGLSGSSATPESEVRGSLCS